jgi:hypothetical protein
MLQRRNQSPVSCVETAITLLMMATTPMFASSAAGGTREHESRGKEAKTMFARGTQPGYSPKEEALKALPGAICERVTGLGITEG